MGSLFNSSKKVAETPASPPPDVREPVKTTPDQQALRRMGRASLLISTSSQGVLGQATTGRRQLLSGGA